MKKIRVLQVTYSLKMSGIETLAVNILSNRNSNKFEYDFAVYSNTSSPEFYDQQVLKLGGKIFKLGTSNKKKNVLSIIFERVNFYKLVKTEKYDIVHIHASSGMHVIETIICKLAGVKKIIVHSHSSKIMNNSRFYIQKKILHYTLKSVWNYIGDEFLSCSSEASKWLFSRKILCERPPEILKNGIDLNKFEFDLNQRILTRKEFNIENDFVIGHIGRFSSIKNQSFIIDIFYEILKVIPNSKLILVGEGEMFETVKLKSVNMGINENCLFLGVRSDVAELLCAFDVFLMPSIFEGLPLVTVEAQASGLPLVVSDSITREIDMTNNVLFVSLNDSAYIWAQEVLKLIDHERYNYCNSISDNGYNILNTVEKLENIYLKTIGDAYEGI